MEQLAADVDCSCSLSEDFGGGSCYCKNEPVMSSEQTLRDESVFIQDVSQFFNQEALSDVRIRVGDQRFFAHKFVLAKSSAVFRTMLYEKRWTKTDEDELELSESPECTEVFNTFLRFLYTAELNICSKTAVGILCLADKYAVESLKLLTTQYMVENSRSPLVRNALDWYSWSKVLCLESLRESCSKTIYWNAKDLLETSEWLQMDIDFVADLLGSSQLVVKDEYSVLEALIAWLLHESRLDKLNENAEQLLPLIRFPQLLVDQLYASESCALAESPQCQALFQKLLSRAYRFRSLCPSQSHLAVSFAEDFFIPRDYLHLTVDSTLLQNTLRFGMQVDVKMFRGAVPVAQRESDWKATYRKHDGRGWQVQLYCHESALRDGELNVQVTLLLLDHHEKVIQVLRKDSETVKRNESIGLSFVVSQPEFAKKLNVLIKPVPS